MRLALIVTKLTGNAEKMCIRDRFTKCFHDRFLIIDGCCAYHIGASFKDAGKKCFAISLMEDRGIVKDILQHLL